MKTLFFIAALVGAIYLVMQSPAGQSWLADNEPELTAINETANEEQVNVQTLATLETKMTEQALHLNQTQQTQIKQLKSRIAELENELIMGRIAQQKTDKTIVDAPSATDIIDAEEFVPLTKPQDIPLGVQLRNTQMVTNNPKIQRNRQARLQDIAEKMEMSSLQALVN
ncbi:DUF2730 domain-containing protein [Paraglaciecola sp. L3A3]|uniref:DUF2730 domain-containing protein n=1 Tax=Paraglaciecola sp. L3A3 TaxID=2686358 RepID=UPI00131B6865|nr:DUF2730 domain-containing protein [Paraglaciecola sp. L3A3]